MHGHLGGTAQGTTAEYVLKLWMAHGITTVREPGSFNGMDWTFRTGAKRRQRDRRAETGHLRRLRHGKRANAEHAGGRSRVGPGRERTRSGWHQVFRRRACRHGSRTGRGAKARAGHGDASRAAQRDPRQRAHLRKLGTHDHGALVRLARSALHRPRDSGLSARLQLQQRAAPVWRGGSALEAGGCAGERSLERRHGFAGRARLHDHAHAHDLRGQPRPDARPQRALARRLHASLRSGTFSSPAAARTGPTGFTGPPSTKSTGKRITVCG